MKTTFACAGKVALAFLVVAVSQAQEPTRIDRIAPVAPDILAVTIQEGHLEHGSQVPYQPDPRDVILDAHHRWVMRGENISVH